MAGGSSQQQQTLNEKRSRGGRGPPSPSCARDDDHALKKQATGQGGRGVGAGAHGRVALQHRFG